MITSILLWFTVVVIFSYVVALIKKKYPSFSWTHALAFIVILVLLLGLGSCSYKVYRRATTPPITVEFPSSGEGYATKEIGLKAWLNPMRTYLRATEPTRYVFVENPEVTFDDLGPIGQNSKEWFNMPAGKYLVYPLKGDKTYFHWWQN